MVLNEMVLFCWKVAYPREGELVPLSGYEAIGHVFEIEKNIGPISKGHTIANTTPVESIHSRCYSCTVSLLLTISSPSGGVKRR